jgi:hypothetical protein
MPITHLERSATLPRPWCLSTDGAGLASTAELTTVPAPPTTTAPITVASMGQLTAPLILTEDTTTVTVDLPPGPTAQAAPVATGAARLPGVTGVAVQAAIGEVQPPGAEDLAPGVEQAVGQARFVADSATSPTTVSDTSPAGS